MDTGVFVLGMHRSGTSAATRLINLLGLATPPDEDLVQPTDKNPKGYWESEALVNFNERVLAAVDCHMSCPIRLERGWERDSRLEDLRRAAPAAVASIFPTLPWVWKDPRHCLTLAFWRHVLPVSPVIVLVNRNPLEVVASTLRLRDDQGKVYTLALWERYLRQALEEIEGLPVLVTNYDELLADPIGWCQGVGAFLASAGIPVHSAVEQDVSSFVDQALRHTRHNLDDLAADRDVSKSQIELFETLRNIPSGMLGFVAPSLPNETPTTEALLDERRRALRTTRELREQYEAEQRASWRWQLRNSKLAAPARSLAAQARRLRADIPRR
jgi:hypothetical protein